MDVVVDEGGVVDIAGEEDGVVDVVVDEGGVVDVAGEVHGVEGFNPGFKIDWAVDDRGRHVNLTHIDFIKVYNAVNQYCGWIGETSTEVAGGIDYHPDAELPQFPAGDVNRDGEVNISDANAVIDMILTGNISAHGDVNGDFEVNISDVNAIISIILQ